MSLDFDCTSHSASHLQLRRLRLRLSRESLQFFLYSACLVRTSWHYPLLNRDLCWSSSMATIRDLLTTKGSQVLTIGPDASVLQAVLLMNDNKIGALVVTKSDEVVGMFTERDLLR